METRAKALQPKVLVASSRFEAIIMGASCSGLASTAKQPNVGTTTNPSPKTVGYITDVEGNWQYFERCVALSSVLKVVEPNPAILHVQNL
jgi:hypothetical protein